MIKKLIFTLMLTASIAACSNDTESIGSAGNETGNTDPIPLACDEGQTCPIGSVCNAPLCESDPSPASGAQFCDDANICGNGYTCTDSNTCEYAQNGVACTAATADATCGVEGFCQFTVEQNCGAEEVEGVCADGFIDAISGDEGVVCGCDGNSYWNSEEALIKQINVASEGLCGDPEA